MFNITRAEIHGVILEYPSNKYWGEYLVLQKDAEVKKYLGTPWSEEECKNARKWPDPPIANDQLLLIIDSCTHAFLGYCGAMRFDGGESSGEDRWEIYCVMVKSAWGKGNGSKIVDFLESSLKAEGKIPVAVVDSKNERSIRMLRKKGWQLTGILNKEDSWQNGNLLFTPS
ncbi:GNAT family N-acetyltransferase [Chitinimonas lacunae]|uniref:GNAT family N-acetyltransferase n=1 Tax=Chitinimonas lacunae TaxID=1963018 RepID=A0ABV8MYV9_9NEIS